MTVWFMTCMACRRRNVYNGSDIMKKALLFFCGMIAGVILTIGVGYLIVQKASGGDEPETPQALYGDPGISLFAEQGDVMSLRSFKVFQVLSNGTALAYSTEKANVQYKWQYGEPVVFLLPEEGTTYYDDLIVKVPSGKVVRQIGTYRYETKNEFVKTVPIVKVQDK